MGTQRPALFTPLKSIKRTRPLATFDTEGNGQAGGFVCGAVASELGRFTFTNPREMLSYLTSPPLRGHWLFAHNLEYDLSVLTSGNFTPFSCLFTEHKILWAETQDSHAHKWRFCDSTNLFPGLSIADLGRMSGAEKLSLPPPVLEHLKNGRPLSELPPDDQHLVLRYCLRDAEILYHALWLLQHELLSLGGRLQPTLAGCSMDLFRRGYLVEPWPVLDPELNRLARSGYYGARTEPYKLGRVDNLNAYDVSSLYPSVQRAVRFPYPGDLSLVTWPKQVASLLDREGFSCCRVSVPDSPVPPLPTRMNRGLYFPSGTLAGVWPHLELREALARGCELQEVVWSLVASTTFNPFTGFIDDLYAKRLLYASSSDFREATFKLLLNSAYGRYGLDTSNTLTALTPIVPPVDWDKLEGADIRVINDWPYLLLPLTRGHPPAYANVMVSAYVAAGARIKMLGEIEPVVDRLAYTDTDSLWLSGEIEEGEGLGGMRLVEKCVDMWVVAPKEYAVFASEVLVSAHVKGVPEAFRLDYLKDGQVTFETPVGIREGYLRGLSPGVWISRLKQRQHQLPKRALDLHSLLGGDYWTTRPWSAPELRSLLHWGD